MEIIYKLNLPIEIISKINKYLTKGDFKSVKNDRVYNEEIKWKSRHSQLKKYYDT